MDTIFINDLKVETIVGVFAWEQKIPQTIYFDIAVKSDTKQAAPSDDLAKTLDYSLLANFITDFLKDHKCKLIETLIETISDKLFEKFAISWLRITLRKPGAIANAKEVGITIERYKKS